MSDEIVIKVGNASKTFRLPHEKNNSLKGAVINFYKSRRTYEKQKALNEISFEVKKGEFFGIVGRNGSGKSTLLKMLAGIYSPSKGTIQVNGKLTPFIELGVGFSPELTGRENVFLNGALFGFSRKEMEKMYPEIVEFAEIERFMDQKLKNYSSGMQVRLAFSIAIRVQSDILLLDEVLAVGDAAFQQKCYNYFEELKKQGKTVVFVSHDMDAIKRFCTRAILIENGETKIIGKTDEVADQYTLDNIRDNKSKQTSSKPKGSTQEKVKELSLELISKKDLIRGDTLKLRAKYSIRSKFEPVIGISIIARGRSIAEINSKAIKLSSNINTVHEAILTTNLSALNPGLYSINIAIFEARNMEMLEYKLNSAQFIIKGHDQTKGGPVHLEGGWAQ